MASVEGVKGAIDAEDLGLTLIHEHFYSGDEAIAANWPHVRDHEREHELALGSAKASSGTASRPWSSRPRCSLGRDVTKLRKLADETGLQIVTCTGIYTYDHLPQFLRNRDEDLLADALRARHRAGHPGHRHQGRLPQGRRRRARGERAHREGPPRGCPREPADRRADHGPLAAGLGHGPRQVEIFLEEGVAPEKIHIAHTGDTDDLGLHRGPAGQGRLDRDGPLRARHLPADRQAQRHGDRAAGEGLRGAHVPLPDFEPRSRAWTGSRAEMLEQLEPPGEGLEHDLPVRVR